MGSPVDDQGTSPNAVTPGDIELETLILEISLEAIAETSTRPHGKTKHVALRLAELDLFVRGREWDGDVVLGPTDEHVIHDLGAGHTLVQLRSHAALRKEGTLLGHCIGQGSYDDFLDDPDVVLASVRDPDGDPLATLEVRGGYIRQLRARSNAEPSNAVRDLVAGAADIFGWQDWRDRPGSRANDPDYGREAVVILRNLPPARCRG